MARKILLLGITTVLIIFSTIFLIPQIAYSAECREDDPCKDKSDPVSRASCYAEIVTSCTETKQSLLSQITVYTSKIALSEAQIEATEVKIAKLEEEIASLSGRIAILEDSLTKVSTVLLERIVETYKRGDSPYFSLLLSSNEFSDFFHRLRLIQRVQTNDKRLLIQTQKTKVTFEEQKALREEKQHEQAALKQQLEAQKIELDRQKKEKEVFLATTRNNETRYQQLLAEAQREAQNIERAISVIAQAGVPKRVSRGDAIGLMGNTGFSTGPHLHFGVYNLSESDTAKFNFDSSHQNPFDILSSKEVKFDATSCDDVSSPTSKSVGGGNWQWPMENPTISQCYGHTPWSWRYRTGIHNAIDMWDNNNIVIRAAEEGNAYSYRGGQSAGNGVFIFHNSGKMTLYWHLQ
ncbi:peptidoglycan DD-metalloendopeptidase family protein [Candidatus Gottesmanbacteria bacterium]|nr:peptidoglycan DD-metalloendopeptidase family protein [Candidatus Gottesmanbacteria bacterium]